jgi:hypothetical protein
MGIGKNAEIILVPKPLKKLQKVHPKNYQLKHFIPFTTKKFFLSDTAENSLDSWIR